MPTFHRLRVSRLTPLTADSVAITLAVPAGLTEAYRFSAGQHLTFAHPGPAGEVRRTFSICTAPGSGELTVAVKILPEGVFSAYVRDRLHVGDELCVLTPAGRFGHPSPPQPGRETTVAVTAGSGITPVLSIMTDLLETDPAARFVLVYGNRSVASVMFAEEIADLKDCFLDRLEVFHVLSGEAPDASFGSGRVDAAHVHEILRLHPPATVRDWYLCGPLAMVESVQRVLADAEVDRHRVHRELFFTGEAAPPPPSISFDSATGVVVARLNGRTSTISMSGHRSILDAVLSVRPDAPFACRGGVCGTCRVRLRRGSVIMDTNYALDPVDLEAGFRLACQSVPVDGDVQVDFDG